MKPLTDRQREVLDAIKRRPLVYQATTRDLAREMGVGSPNGVQCHLNALEKKGYIRRGRARWGIEVIEPPEAECPQPT